MGTNKKILACYLVLAIILAPAVCRGSADEDTQKSKEGSIPTFEIVTVRWTDGWPIDFLKTGVMAELEAEHNVTIDWDVYYNSDWAEQKSLLLAAGADELPDAFFGSISLKDADIAQNEGYFVELTDLIEENMPNLTRIFEEDPAMKAMVTNRDNKIYSLPKKLPLRPKVADVMFINQTWLDALGLPMPTTYLELEKTLKAFVTQDPNENGKNDEFGYTNQYSLRGDMRQVLSPFGTMVSRQDNYMGLIDGEPVFMPVEENYYDAVVWMRGMYVDGLLDDEGFTQDSAMVDGKTKAQDGSLSGIGFGWTADAEFQTNEKDYAIVPALKGPDGKRYAEHAPEFLDQSRNELVITTACEDPAALLRWADSFYTDEVSLQTFYGSISDGKIAKNTDGTYELLVPQDGSSLDTSAWSYSFRDFGPKYMNESFKDKVILPEDQGDGIKLSSDYINADYINKTFPVVSYTSDQVIELANLSTDIYEFVENKYALWIVEGGIEEEWGDYLDQLDAMGLQRLFEIQMDAYDAYIAIVGN